LNKKKTKICITGATGTVGSAILSRIDTEKYDVTAAVRDVAKAAARYKGQNIRCIPFDIERQQGFEQLTEHDIVFLLRPPHIGDVQTYFAPLLQTLAKSAIGLVVFLSVQGAGEKQYLPHSKIEKIIREKNIPYTFLRPSYFMDNLTSTLYREIRENNRIFLPAGRLQLNWIDVEDIAAVFLSVIESRKSYIHTAVELTNNKNYSFQQVVQTINAICHTSVRYQSPNVIRYIFSMKRNKYSLGFIGVMLLLHFLPRFTKKPTIHADLQNILKRSPNQIEDFIVRNKDKFTPLQ